MTFQFEAIGTGWRIDLYEPLAAQQYEQLQHEIAERVEQFDKAYSRFRADSMVTAMSRTAGTYEFSEDGVVMFNFYRQLYEATNGNVTPLIGGALHDAGYDAEYSLRPKPVRPIPAWDDVMTISGSTIKTTKPVQLDFGAAGKGYLVDIITDIIRTYGVAAFTVDGGGDMYHQGPEALRVGLEHPESPGQVIGAVELKNQALCGSAINRRAWGEYHHVMDPFARRSTTDISASWVIAESGLKADGLATALFFVEPSELQVIGQFESVVVRTDGSATVSTDLPGHLFKAGE